jgi:hypothetical protein
LTGATNATITDGQAIGTILNDDVPSTLPNISISNVTVAEGGVATFQVTLSAASSQTVTVNFATANGTALVGSDYNSNSGVLTFNPGQTSKQISVSTIDDMSSEPTENFFVNLSGATNANIAVNQGTATILDNEVPVPAISISDVSQLEGNSGLTPFVFTVTLSVPSTQTVSVRFATANGTANGYDYQGNVANLTFNPGQTSKTITINVIGELLVEPNQTFFVNLTNPVNATINDSQGLGTIINDDTGGAISSLTAGPSQSGGGSLLMSPLAALTSGGNDYQPVAFSLPSRLSSSRLVSANGLGSLGVNAQLASSAARLSWGASSRETLASDFRSRAKGMTLRASSQKVYVLSGEKLETVAVDD